MDLTVSFLVITMNRFDDLRKCVESILAQKYDNSEVIIVDNNSKYDDYVKFKNEYEDKERVKVLRSEKNRGVSGGRNYGIQHVRGDIIITIDDDAIIKDPDTTARIVRRMSGSNDVGVLAFRITNYYTGKLEKDHFPFKNKDKSPNKEHETAWFIGAGHAIKKEVYENVGLYKDYFPYGHEELDFSLRVIDCGYKIVYFPNAEVLHKRSPGGGSVSSSSEYYSYVLSNRIKVSVHNLPWMYVITTSIVRTIKYLIESKFDVCAIVSAYRKLLSQWDQIKNERSVISSRALQKAKKLKGPVFY